MPAALASYGVAPDTIPTAFDVFMNVPVDAAIGAIRVEPPLSGAGDYTVFEALMDRLIGLTACSAGPSNNFAFMPIQYEVM